MRDGCRAGRLRRRRLGEKRGTKPTSEALTLERLETCCRETREG